MSKAKKVAETDEEKVRLAHGDDTLTAPDPVPTGPEGVKIHLAKYEAAYGIIPAVVRPAIYANHRFEMRTKEEWERLFGEETNRRIS